MPSVLTISTDTFLWFLYCLSVLLTGYVDLSLVFKLGHSKGLLMTHQRIIHRFAYDGLLASTLICMKPLDMILNILDQLYSHWSHFLTKLVKAHCQIGHLLELLTLKSQVLIPKIFHYSRIFSFIKKAWLNFFLFFFDY